MTAQPNTIPLAITDRIEDAILSGRAHLLFQPVFDVGPMRRVAFHEGLLRLEDADGVVIEPVAFLPVAERADLMPELDALALDLAVAALERTEAFRLSVNLSPRSLRNPLIRLRLARLTPRIADRLILEITEVAPLSRQDFDCIAEYRRAGCTVLLDDFGAGASSVRYLLDGGVDGVKIDRHLITGIAGDRARQEVFLALRCLAEGLDLWLIPEGVEYPADAAWLERHGATTVQGYLFGKPGPLPTPAAPPIAERVV
ncbi:MAG: EAL domain-containing protein [Rubricella sp.]